MPDGSEPSIWVCSSCDKTFGSAAELYAHRSVRIRMNDKGEHAMTFNERGAEYVKPSGLDPRLEAIRGAIDSTPIEVICNPDDASRVRAALVGMGRPFEVHQDPGIRDGRVIVVNKARLVHIPRPPEGEDPTLKMERKADSSTQCARCDHTLSDHDHNSANHECNWRHSPSWTCLCQGFTTDATDWRALNDRAPERKVPAREELIKSGDLVELPDYWCGP